MIGFVLVEKVEKWQRPSGVACVWMSDGLIVGRMNIFVCGVVNVVKVGGRTWSYMCSEVGDCNVCGGSCIAR